MFYIRFSFIFILLLSGACGKKDDNSVNTHLYGAWDSYKAILPNNTINGPAPWILCCYEQGIELFANGKYSSRYRSEEHTSELQSRLHLVCRRLLEKKNAKRLRSLTGRHLKK